MRRWWGCLSGGALIGWTAGALESAFLAAYLDLVVVDPLGESLDIAWRYALAGAAGGALGWLGMRALRGRRASVSGALGLATFGLGFLVAGDWVHEVVLAATPFLAPVSLAASCAVVILAALLGGLLARALGARPGRTAALLALVALGAQGTAVLGATPAGRRYSDHPPPADPATHPNVLMIVIDTLRADRLSCYGYPRPTSPEIDALAERGVLFERAYAQAPWTRASVASLLTSLYPASHRTNSIWERMAESLVTLPEVLREAGYRTACFSANENVSPVFGFDQGFEDFWIFRPSQLLRYTAWGRIEDWVREKRGWGRQAMAFDGSDSESVNEKIFSWADRVERDRPYFLYVQYIDPHSPYHAPEDLINEEPPDADDMYRRGKIPHTCAPYPFEVWPEQEEGIVEGIEALYDAEIRFVDRSIGRLLRRFEDQGWLENSYVVVTADHGEEFYDHGQLGHGQSVFDELVRVPLIVVGPGLAPARRVEPVELIDLFPTVIDWAGLKSPQSVHGVSLAPLLAGGSGEQFRTSWLHRVDEVDPVAGLLVGTEKIIEVRHEDQVRTLLFDLASDPREQHDLSAERAERFGQLLEQLEAVRRLSASLGPGRSESVDLDDTTLRRLRDLGYVGDDGLKRQ